MITILLLLSFISSVSANNITISHREIFNTNLGLDVLLLFLVLITSIITTIGGVGGGGLLIPIYMLIGGFTLEEAIPLSIATILGNTFIRIIKLYNKKHPMNSERYLIDMMPVLLIIPFDGNTSFIGLILSQWTPKLLTLILIIITLGFTFYKSIVKAIKSFLNENKYFKEEQELEMVMIDGIAEYFNASDLEEARSNEGEGDNLKDKIIKTLIAFFSILLISIFSITRSFLPKCGLGYWLQIIGQFILVSIIGYCIIRYVRSDYEKKRDSGYAFLPGDIIWKKKNIVKFVLISSVTGALSTYMGIGGGMLITPIMMQVGMIPEVVVATSSITTFFSSIISTINYSVAGKLLFGYAGIFSVSSAIGSLIGLTLADIILQKYKRQSIIIFMVSLILFTSTILLTVNAISDNDISQFEFNNICE